MCDSIGYVADINYPDDTVIIAGKSFTKTWRLINTGTCTWSKDYSVVFDSGYAMGAANTFNLPSQVGPGQMIDLKIGMKAPSAPRPQPPVGAHLRVRPGLSVVGWVQGQVALAIHANGCPVTHQMVGYAITRVEPGSGMHRSTHPTITLH